MALVLLAYFTRLTRNRTFATANKHSVCINYVFKPFINLSRTFGTSNRTFGAVDIFKPFFLYEFETMNLNERLFYNAGGFISCQCLSLYVSECQNKRCYNVY